MYPSRAKGMNEFPTVLATKFPDEVRFESQRVNIWMNSSMAERRLVKPWVESSNLSSSAKALWQRWFYCTGLKGR